MYCPYCGSQIPDNTCYCPYCGSQISAQPQQSESFYQPYAPETAQQYTSTDADSFNRQYDTSNQNTSLAQYYAPNNYPASNAAPPYPHVPCCPRCGSTNIGTITESSSSGSDYSAGGGCLGYLLFGPLGLLCGLCGSNKKKTVTYTRQICYNCGEKIGKRK